MKAIPCPVSPEELRRLVRDEKLTDAEVAARLPGGTIKRVVSWRHRYGIEVVARWERRDLPPIEGKLKSLLVGSMLAPRVMRALTFGAALVVGPVMSLVAALVIVIPRSRSKSM